MQLFLLLILTLAVCTTAQNCLSQIKCSAECAPYRADKPRPRIYQSCLAGCNGGLKGSCSVCNTMPKPHPRTNKICSKACKNSGSQLRKCEKTKAKDEQVKREQSETQQAPTESVERRLETEVIETAATNAVPSADMEAKIKAVADAARVEQKALDDQTIANAVAAAAKDAANAAAAKLQEETNKSVESAKIAAEAQKVAAEEAVKAEAQALAAAQDAQDAAEAEALAEAEAGK